MRLTTTFLVWVASCILIVRSNAGLDDAICPSGHHSIHDYLISSQRPPLNHPLMDPTAVQMMMDGKYDLVTITRIECRQVSTGISSITKGIFAAFGAAIASGVIATGEGAVVVGTGGAAIGTLPVTAGAVASAASSGAGAAVELLKYLDKLFSTADNLYVTLHGVHVIPRGLKKEDIKRGQVIKPNVVFPIPGGTRMELFDYDYISSDDSLGKIDINPDVSPGQSYIVPGALAWSDDEGSMYQVDYTVTRNPTQEIVQYLFCGSNFCRLCIHEKCINDTHDGLDRSKHQGDLKACPPPFVQDGYKKYKHIWPLSPTYLRICKFSN